MFKRTLLKITDNIDYNANTYIVSYLNIYNYKILRRKPKLLNAIDFYTLDGIMLSLFIRILWQKKIKRKSPDFSSYFQELFNYMNSNQSLVYFIGGTKEEMDTFVHLVKNKYPKIEITGFEDGFGVDFDILLKTLLLRKVQILIVGMGTPKQEKLMVDLKNNGYMGKSFSCGAFFGQTARKGEVYYPKWINYFHLRWTYRIYEEPKLLNRYIIDYPIGLFFLIKDSVNSKF